MFTLVFITSSDLQEIEQRERREVEQVTIGCVCVGGGERHSHPHSKGNCIYLLHPLLSSNGFTALITYPKWHGKM